MRKISLVLMLLISIILSFCISCNESKKSKDKSKDKINPWLIFYKLVPNTPGKGDVSGIGIFDVYAKTIPIELYLCPQVNFTIDNIIKEYGTSDSIGFFKNVFPPISLNKVIPEYKNIYFSNDSIYSYDSIYGVKYMWDNFSFIVKNGKILLIKIELVDPLKLANNNTWISFLYNSQNPVELDSIIRKKIYAPNEQRISLIKHN